MSATHTVHSTTTAAPVLYVAFELGWTTWKMAFTIGAGQPLRIRTVPARLPTMVLTEIKKAKVRFGLPPTLLRWRPELTGFLKCRCNIRLQGHDNTPGTLPDTEFAVARSDAVYTNVASVPMMVPPFRPRIPKVLESERSIRPSRRRWSENGQRLVIQPSAGAG